MRPGCEAGEPAESCVSCSGRISLDLRSPRGGGCESLLVSDNDMALRW